MKSYYRCEYLNYFIIEKLFNSFFAEMSISLYIKKDVTEHRNFIHILRLICSNKQCAKLCVVP